MNGTAAVFQDIARKRQRYLVIDGRGEVSTDYFSMRAFRFLALLPAFCAPDPKNALVVTFGSGIVAGSIAGIPGLEQEDCVELCGEAFEAARFFASENHDVLHSIKMHRIVNDGRNYVLTTSKGYDIISADATHPTSSDSWTLYTKEFYELCRDRLNAGGVISQWMPLHGILEKDYKTILKTFHSVFPFVAVYYSGGLKTIGHSVLLGSTRPLQFQVQRALRLLEDHQIKEDLHEVRVLSIYDLFNAFVTDQDSIDELTGDVPINTDDKPRVVFSKSEVSSRPNMGLAPLAKYRKSIYSELSDIENAQVPVVERTVRVNFEATGYALEGQIEEFEEYGARMTQTADQPTARVLGNLTDSIAKLERILANYELALHINERFVGAREVTARARGHRRNAAMDEARSARAAQRYIRLARRLLF